MYIFLAVSVGSVVSVVSVGSVVSVVSAASVGSVVSVRFGEFFPSGFGFGSAKVRFGRTLRT